mmetsp:Transcript_7484/g.13476  ORF Transcript_7484/g.13476 Transcript_7484/m.13476 type:complete len:212 (+) Transcript_7484:65-700(+)
MLCLSCPNVNDCPVVAKRQMIGVRQWFRRIWYHPLDHSKLDIRSKPIRIKRMSHHHDPLLVVPVLSFAPRVPSTGATESIRPWHHSPPMLASRFLLHDCHHLSAWVVPVFQSWSVVVTRRASHRYKYPPRHPTMKTLEWATYSLLCGRAIVLVNPRVDERAPKAHGITAYLPPQILAQIEPSARPTLVLLLCPGECRHCLVRRLPPEPHCC